MQRGNLEVWCWVVKDSLVQEHILHTLNDMYQVIFNRDPQNLSCYQYLWSL
jgi:hypothetical protein